VERPAAPGRKKKEPINSCLGIRDKIIRVLRFSNIKFTKLKYEYDFKYNAKILHTRIFIFIVVDKITMRPIPGFQEIRRRMRKWLWK
jgi:hypothetical protein